ncbi:hypothetical protein PILCRDRAFT_814730 [Piloderma croceum F 1598]|uniref:Uncharacterized protein n=1 Tax=Piloderma croceum (strain F 1598) TaxID=765440 RepID=A0A0C3BNK0_PILCF|nr:hypothetical protein PILCRDRAFT_814730 [Piloderma croceum F 1598]
MSMSQSGSRTWGHIPPTWDPNDMSSRQELSYTGPPPQGRLRDFMLPNPFIISLSWRQDEMTNNNHESTR